MDALNVLQNENDELLVNAPSKPICSWCELSSPTKIWINHDDVGISDPANTGIRHFANPQVLVFVQYFG